MINISIKNVISLLSLVFLVACGPSAEKKIIGKWYFERSYDVPSNSPSIKVTRREVSVSEYFPNGSSVLSRRVFMSQSNSEQNASPRLIETAVDINFSREWMIKDDKIISKIIDVKTTPVYLKRDGVLANGEDTKAFFEKFKKPEDVIPKGQTVQVKIILLEKDKYIFEAEINGKIETITAVQTEKSLSELAK